MTDMKEPNKIRYRNGVLQLGVFKGFEPVIFNPRSCPTMNLFPVYEWRDVPTADDGDPKIVLVLK